MGIRFIVDGTAYTNVTETAAYIVEQIPESSYDETLDECYGDISICGYSYSASRAFQAVDPTAYRCGFLDYIDSAAEEIRYDMERMTAGDTAEFYGCTVELECEDEDEDELYLPF